MACEQRKLAAIVAADVVGYSRLMGRKESGTLARFRSATEQQKPKGRPGPVGLLLGVDRTYGGHHEPDANDPKLTFGLEWA